MRTLRARLLAATAAVLAVVLTALALFSARINRIEFHRLEDVLSETRESADPARQILETGYRSAGSWSAARESLDRAAEATRRDVLVVDARGFPVARSSNLTRATVVPLAPDGLRVEWSDPARRLVLRAPGIVVRDGSGGVAGRFYLLPRENAFPDRRREPAASANGWLAGAAIAAGAAALFLIWALSRRLLGPIESLTEAARLMESGSRAARVPMTSRDELGDLARSFNSMADAIDLQETLRRNLVNDVAHELRTPLTNIRAQLEALQDGLAAPDAKTIDSLHDDARLLERLVDDLQDLALAEAGQLTLRPEPVQLASAAERAAEAMQSRARAAGVQIAVEVPGSLSVLADRDRLNQILSNLLGNALTHTEAGGRVVISGVPVDGKIETAVTDTGNGIEPGHLVHVFDRFYRADPSRTRATGGTGLGLAIVRQLVELQRGTVGAVSEPGRGTTIAIRLPRAPDRAAEPSKS